MLPLKFFTRPEIKPGLVLTERDRALVRWCYELRAPAEVHLGVAEAESKVHLNFRNSWS
ncbi:hypothetical protein HY009_05825 [Candidatus Acetothermia bacterium]|nr:hypothetical protein [Candidatus Acetothermia bacterium]